MRIGNLSRTGSPSCATGGRVDVERASGGRFGSDPQAIYDALGRVRGLGSRRADGEPWDRAGGCSAPVPRPRQVFALGLNYALHAREAGLELPPMPLTFTKFPSCIDRSRRDGAASRPTAWTGRSSWSRSSAARAPRGRRRMPGRTSPALTVGQDLSARDVQMLGSPPQFSLGKSFPGFGPTGPWLVTPDELRDPDDLAIGCAVNGEQVQSRSHVLDAVLGARDRRAAVGDLPAAARAT